MNGDPRDPPLRAAFDALPVALVVFDAEARLLHANPALWASLGVEPAALPHGMALREVARMFAYRGAFGPGDPEAQAAAQAQVDRSRPHRRLFRRTDGSCWELHRAPVPGGGFLTASVEVTGFVEAEAEATAQARLLLSVLSHLEGGVALFDAEERLLLHNRAYEEFSRLPPGMLRPGMTYAALLRELTARGKFATHDGEERIAAWLALDRSRPQAAQHERPTGEVTRIATRPMPAGGFLVEVDDVTALKRAQDEAQGRAALLDAVLAALPHGVCVWGPDRRVAMVNAAYARLLPSTRIAPGEPWAEVIRRHAEAGDFGPGDPAETARAQAALDVSRPQAARRVLRDGTAIDVRTAPLPDGGHIGVVTDITALHRAEAEATRRAAILEAMLENIRHGICLFDAEGTVVAANALACRMTGLSREEMAPGRRIEDLRRLQSERGEFGAVPEAEAWVAARNARGWFGPDRFTRRRPDGTLLEVTTDPTPDGGFVRTYTDVTEDRRIREELRAAKEAAEAASGAKSRFLATMSHELRTPLNAVIGFSEALLADPASPDAGEFLRAIHDAGRHLLGLIDDVLDVARAGAAGFAVSAAAPPLDPARLAEEAVRVMGAEAAAGGLTLTATLAPDLPRLRADERRLRQVLLNLLSNAVKFTPSGGRVELSAALDPASGDLLFRVADSGIGMRPRDIPRAFEPFTQLDTSLARRFGGSGLGLPLSRALAEAHGGALTLESAPETGTVATLRLPKSRLLLPAATTTA